MKRLGRWLVMGVVAVGSAALAQGAPAQDTGLGQDTSQQATGGSGKTATQPAASSATAQPAQGGSGAMSMMGNLPMPKDEQDLANHLHHVNQMEIQLAQLAAQKASSNDVKQYAQDMLKDHQAADQKLSDWAKTKNLTLADVQPANDVAQKKMQLEQANRDLLQSLDGMPFDTQYLSSQVAGHDNVLGMLMAAQQQFASSDVAPLLKSLQPTIREHRNHAYRLLGEQNKAMRQARSSSTTGR